MLFDISKHFLIRPTRRVIVKSVFRNVILDEFIRSVSGLADFAVHKRVGKSAEVSRRHPCFGVHKYCAVKTDVVRAFLHEFFPPCSFDVVFQFNAERTVVPGVCETAVYLRAGIYKASAFAKRDYFIHSLFFVVHILTFSVFSYIVARRSEIPPRRFWFILPCIPVLSRFAEYFPQSRYFHRLPRPFLRVRVQLRPQLFR